MADRSARPRLPLLLLPLALLAGCNPQGGAGEVTFDVPVVVQKAALGHVERTLTTTGTVRAVEETRLVTPTAGKLVLLRNPATKHPYREGDAVAQGTIIAVVEGEEQKVGKEAGIEAKRRRLEAAEAEMERNQRLHDEGIVTDADLKQAQSEAAAARYDYEQALIVKEQTRVVSPMSGILADVTRAGANERVAAGYEVAKVVDFREVIVDGRLSASDLALVGKGNRARVSSYSYPDRLFEGVVSNVAPTVDPDTRTFLVEVRLDNPKGLLRPGLFVKTEIVVEEKDGVLVVPKDAVVLRQSRPVVFVVERQVAHERPVELGLDGGERVEVLSGIEPGDRYVVVGQQTLTDNSPVRARSS